MLRYRVSEAVGAVGQTMPNPHGRRTGNHGSLAKETRDSKRMGRKAGRGLLLCLALAAGFTLLCRSPRAYAYEAIKVTNGGQIFGTVKFGGEVPAIMPISVNKSHEVCGLHIQNESLVVGPRNGLRYAVVTLADIIRGRAPEIGETHSLDNRKCTFSPHVQAVTTGQFLDLKNSDPILHDFDALSADGQTLFNVGMWPNREVRRPVAYPGVIHITCYIHKWMSAYVVVTEHPYHAVTDIYGNYQIDDVPPGTYKVRVWHERLGTIEKQVQVQPNGKTELDFVMKDHQK